MKMKTNPFLANLDIFHIVAPLSSLFFYIGEYEMSPTTLVFLRNYKSDVNHAMRINCLEF